MGDGEGDGAGGVAGEVAPDPALPLDPLLRLYIGVLAGVVYSTSPTCGGTSMEAYRRPSLREQYGHGDQPRWDCKIFA